ncbi:MAG TPA: helix-turn-helix transcriptional regulator [Massilibacterium sp.]|nr:helix-turn-helix transcriptional regulator [Massilibacterium sp.]
MNNPPLKRKDTMRSLRVKFGYTQKDLSSYLGVSRERYLKLERDSSDITLNLIKGLEELYGVEMNYIFFGPESTFREQIKKENVI